MFTSGLYIQMQIFKINISGRLIINIMQFIYLLTALICITILMVYKSINSCLNINY